MTPETYRKWMAARTKHGGFVGGSETPEHYVWRSMLARCNNPKDKAYKYYGAKGILVSKRWHAYENFVTDMGMRPSAQHSLDRKDPLQGYTKRNCRWATRSEQQKNKTTTRYYTNGTFVGTLVECAGLIGLSKELAHWRFKNWNTFERGVVWRERPKAR